MIRTVLLTMLLCPALRAQSPIVYQTHVLNVTLTAGQPATLGGPDVAGEIPGLFSAPKGAKGSYTQSITKSTTPYGVIDGAGASVKIPKVSSADQGLWTVVFRNSTGAISFVNEYNVTVVNPPTPTPTAKPVVKPTPTPTPKPTPTPTTKKK